MSCNGIPYKSIIKLVESNIRIYYDNCFLIWIPINEEISFCTILINILRPRQVGRHFTDDIFKRIFENVWISTNISLFIPKCPIDNILTLVRIRARRRQCDEPLSEPKLVSLTDAYMRHSCSINWNVYSFRPMQRCCHRDDPSASVTLHWLQSPDLPCSSIGLFWRNYVGVCIQNILKVIHLSIYIRKIDAFLWSRRKEPGQQ